MRTANPMHKIKECPYDVGDILQTRNAAHPSTRWPGTTWAAIDTMLLGASTAHPAGETGGEETVDLSDMQAYADIGLYGGAVHSYRMDEYASVNWKISWSNPNPGTSTDTIVPATPVHFQETAHNNMPPYTAVYIWERTG